MRSSVWLERFKELQLEIHQTNLEHQGLFDVRWLSCGDAVARLCRILGATIVVFIEYKHSMAVTVQTLKFHFCLYFLADLLAEINALNKFFQRKKVDITLVHQEVDRTIGAIRLRYMEYVDIFGEGVSKLLSPFIARLGSGRRTICVDGTDADGEPSSYQIVLSEAPIPGHQYGGSMTDCIKLCKAFALEVATNMHTRMWSLKQMEGSKLHKVETWLEASDKRERRVLSWLDASARLFNNRLPENAVPPSHVAGFNHRAAELELASFCHVMSRHYQDDDFYQAVPPCLPARFARAPCLPTHPLPAHALPAPPVSSAPQTRCPPAACALPACTPHAPCPSALLRAAAAVTSAAATAACTAAAAKAAATAACPTRNRAALPNALPARERASCPRAPLRPCPLALSASSLRPTVRCCCCHLCSPSCCMRCCCYLLMLLSTTVVAERAAAAIAAASVPAAAPELLLPNALLLLLLLQVVLLLRLRCCRYPRCLHAPSPRAAAAAAVRLLLRDAAAAATCCSCCSLLQLLLLAATCCSCHSLLLLLLAAAAPYCHCCYNSSCCCCCCYGYCSYG
ncbi:unnamed protein product [Closterium sp. NIES-53]